MKVPSSVKRPIPKLDDRFFISIKGKDFILYAGVLDLATQKGLLKLEVELLQYPSKENGNEAICRAVAEGKSGQVFSDIGDANPNNCHSLIAPHLIRMASTRAKGRVLRDMCNIGIACLEELSDFDDVIGSDRPKKALPKKTAGKAEPKAPPIKTAAKTKPPVKSAPEPKAVPKQVQPSENEKPKTDARDQGNSSQPKMSLAQKKAIFNLSRRRGISVEELEKMAIDAYSVELESLNSSEASSFIRNLQQAA